MTFVEPLLNWYAHHARELPWRLHQTPYRTWVSEIMLQQTQVDTVIPYFQAWMKLFPDIQSLAEAERQDVLSAWEGLGYYTRARNLHKAAKIVLTDYLGQLPETAAELQRLPGIGPYTAGAIASIAFGENVPAVDGNIRRVLSRLFDVREPARSTTGQKQLWALAKTHLPPGQAGEYNQALMDLGAMICTPKNPDCPNCPVSNHCLAYQRGVQAERPVKLPKKQTPHLTVTAAVIRKDGRALIAQRPDSGLLGGMWEFPGGTLEDRDPDLEYCLAREIREELNVDINIHKPFGEYHHAYTHFKITLHAFLCSLPDEDRPEPMDHQEIAWVKMDELVDYPMGKVDRQIANRLMEVNQDGILSG